MTSNARPLVTVWLPQRKSARVSPGALERIAFDQVHLIKRYTQHTQRLACLGSRSI
jgi:hypothetical protein